MTGVEFEVLSTGFSAVNLAVLVLVLYRVSSLETDVRGLTEDMTETKISVAVLNSSDKKEKHHG